jgi:alpha-amylase
MNLFKSKHTLSSLMALSLLAMVSCATSGGSSSTLSSSSSKVSSSSSSASSSSASSSSSEEGEAINFPELQIPETTDKYGTFYEIFPYSFADSDGDGIGDIQGIEDKLDYISNLNYDGVWLTPVHKSGTYHKYDVDDYESIDPDFGTLADYDSLVTKLHGKKMKILLDLVFNHSSTSNIWFSKCIEAHYNKQTSSRYYNYYNVAPLATGGTPNTGWVQSSDYPTLQYEAKFWSGMPDFNLDEVLTNPNGNLATSLKDVMKFWLVDHNVDGFRLDAVTSYFTGNQDKNTQFLKWLHDYCVSIKSDVYIVGEGSWGNQGENKTYQSGSNVDSFFNFECQGADGYPAQLAFKHDASYLYYGINKTLSSIGNTGIVAPFIANHDTGRLYAAAHGSTSLGNVKMAYGALQMYGGCTFSYYGDEAGLQVLYTGGTSGYKDEDKRQPMPWGDKYRCKPVTGSKSGTDAEKYPLGTIESQVADSSSLINFVKQANAVRRAYPQIARGTTAKIYTSDDDSLQVISKNNGGKIVYIALNAAASATTYDYSALASGVEVKAEVTSQGSCRKLGDKKIKIPAQSILVLA